MMQIEIHKNNGSHYRGTVPSLTDVAKLAKITTISKIILFAITPREFNYLRSLDLPEKIKISR